MAAKAVSELDGKPEKFVWMRTGRNLMRKL